MPAIIIIVFSIFWAVICSNAGITGTHSLNEFLVVGIPALMAGWIAFDYNR